MNLDLIRSAITAGLLAVPGVTHVDFYVGDIPEEDDIRESLKREHDISVFIDEGNPEPEDAMGAAATAERLSFSAMLFIHRQDENAWGVIRGVAQAVVARIDQTCWGLDNFGLARLEGSGWDKVSSDQGAFRAYQIEFSHVALFPEGIV